MTYSDHLTAPLIGDQVFGTPHNGLALGVDSAPLAGIVVGVEQLPGINLRVVGTAKQFLRGQVIERRGVVAADGSFEVVQVEVWGDSRKFHLLHREAA